VKHYLPFIFCALALLLSCSKDKNPVNPKSTREITVTTLNESEAPIAGVEVKLVDGQTGVTDADGKIVFVNVASNSLGRYFAVSKSNVYFSCSQAVTLPAGVNRGTIKMILTRRSGFQEINTTLGGVVSLASGASIEIPANAFRRMGQDEVYNGTARVYITNYSTEDNDFGFKMPGASDLLGLTAQGLKTLYSFGGASIEIEDPTGGKLDLREGTTARFILPVASTQIDVAPPTIGLWNFEFEKGYWEVVQTATRTGTYYVGDVTHFSCWGMDETRQTGTIRGSVLDSSGNGVEQVGLRIGQQSIITGPAGNFELKVPINVPLRIRGNKGTRTASADYPAFTFPGQVRDSVLLILSGTDLVCQPTVTDIDGNVYNVVRIGSQCWMKENLKTTRYRAGSAIATGLSNSQWASDTSGAYAIYNNLGRNDTLFGKLYNWYAVNNTQGLCPAGWHVPTDAEWKSLEAQLGMPANELDQIGPFRGESQNVGGKLKAVSSLWQSPNVGATDESGFSGLPGPIRTQVGIYATDTIGSLGIWWSFTGSTASSSWTRYLDRNSGSSQRWEYDRRFGLSVRCLKD